MKAISPIFLHSSKIPPVSYTALALLVAVALLDAIWPVPELQVWHTQPVEKELPSNHNNDTRPATEHAAPPVAVIEKYFVQEKDYDRKGTDTTGKPVYATRATCRLGPACITLGDTRVEKITILTPARGDHGRSSGIDVDALSGCLVGETTSIQFAMTRSDIDDGDLFLASFPLAHDDSLPHFVMRSGKLLDMVDAALGTRNSSGHQYAYEKHTLRSSGLWNRAIEAHPPSLEQRRATLKPVVLVSPDLTDRRDQANPKMVWVLEYINLLFAGISNSVRFIQPPVDSSSSQTTCFNSVWTAPLESAAARQIEYSRHHLFTENDISKRPRPDMCSGNSIQVTILDRKETRALKNVPEIKAAVRSALSRYFKSIQIDHVFFEDDTSFYNQSTVMQRTDVLIAAHGAAIGNAVFMRQRSYLLEISPFCYYYKEFQTHLRSTFDVDGGFVSCESDRDSFTNTLSKICVEKCPPKMCSGDCNQLLQAFKNLERSVDMPFLQQDITNSNTYPDCVLLKEYTAGLRALKAQSLRPKRELIEAKLLDWVSDRCPQIHTP